MTEPTDAVEPTTEPDVADDDELRAVKRECQRLRGRLRDAEETIAGQAAREAVHQRAVIEQAAKAAGFYDPTDFLAAHPDTSEFVDPEFSDVLADRVTQAAAALLEQKPYLGRPVGPPPSQRPVEGLRPGARAPEDKTAAPSWATALRGRIG